MPSELTVEQLAKLLYETGRIPVEKPAEWSDLSRKAKSSYRGQAAAVLARFTVTPRD